MKTDFEQDVRAAFAARVEEIPAGAACRLRAVDYRPREHRLRGPVGVAAGGLAGAAAVGTTLAVVLGGAAPAYAGWSATPTASAPPSSAVATCQGQLSQQAAGPGATSAGPWDNVLTDVRGPFTVALFSANGAYAACFTSASFTVVNQISSNGGASSGSTSVNEQGGGGTGSGTPASGESGTSISRTSSGSLQLVVQSHLSTTSDGPYTLLEGRTQPGVSAVTLVRDDGQDVVATVADGWFIAWWPGGASATSAAVTTSSGTATEALVPGVQPNPPTPSGPCAPSATSASAAGSSTSTSCGGSGGPSGTSTNGGAANSGNSGNSGSGSTGNI